MMCTLFIMMTVTMKITPREKMMTIGTYRLFCRYVVNTSVDADVDEGNHADDDNDEDITAVAANPIAGDG